MGSSSGIQTKSRIPEQVIESKGQVSIPERLPEKLSAEAQSPEVTKPRVEWIRGEESRRAPYKPRSTQVVYKGGKWKTRHTSLGPEIISKKEKKGFTFLMQHS